MKGQKTPSRKRWAKCPQCGLYYAPAGLTGHMRFYHKMGIGKKKQDPVEEAIELNRQVKRLQLIELAGESVKTGDPSLRKRLIDAGLELLVIDYIFQYGIFKD